MCSNKCLPDFPLNHIHSVEPTGFNLIPTLQLDWMDCFPLFS